MTQLTNSWSWSRLLATSHLKIDLGVVAHWRRANTQPPTKQKLTILRRKKGPISNLGRNRKVLGASTPADDGAAEVRRQVLFSGEVGFACI